MFKQIKPKNGFASYRLIQERFYSKNIEIRNSSVGDIILKRCDNGIFNNVKLYGISDPLFLEQTDPVTGITNPTFIRDNNLYKEVFYLDDTTNESYVILTNCKFFNDQRENLRPIYLNCSKAIINNCEYNINKSTINAIDNDLQFLENNSVYIDNLFVKIINNGNFVQSYSRSGIVGDLINVEKYIFKILSSTQLQLKFYEYNQKWIIYGLATILDSTKKSTFINAEN